MPSGSRTTSTALAAMAELGMPSYRAEAGSCANVMPPSALTATRPSEPSEAVPESTTPMARVRWSSARERRK